MTLFEIIKKNLTKQYLVETATGAYIKGVCDCEKNQVDHRRFARQMMASLDQEQDDKEIDVDVEVEG